MDFKIGDTYKISTPGLLATYGTLTGLDKDSHGAITISWRSDHPKADSDHWCRPHELIGKVAPGTYLGDDGKPVNPRTFKAKIVEDHPNFFLIRRDDGAEIEIPWHCIDWPSLATLGRNVTVYRVTEFGDYHIYV